MSDLKILIEEIARVALEDEHTRNRIGHELDVSDEELMRVFDYLSSMLEKSNENQ